MDAIGFIETRGLIPAIEAADVMLKSAQVALVERSIVGGGIVTITVTGDVGAVKSAVDAGASATKNFGGETLVSQHIIPRPNEQIAEVIFNEKKLPSVSTESIEAEEKKQQKLEEVKVLSVQEQEAEVQKKNATSNAEKFIVKEEYKELTVKELRKLAKKYNNLGMTDEELQTANRAVLRDHFEKYSNN